MTLNQSDLGHEPSGLSLLIRLIADRARAQSDHKVKLCFFLGAGADFSSGGLSFSDLKRQAIEEYSQRPIFDLTRPEQVELEFERLFSNAPPDDRALLIEGLFRRLRSLEPSDGYKLLVLLAEAGGVDAVVTTNFDLMLERAQAQLGRDIFQVYAPGFAKPYLVSNARYELPKKPYLKLHGDLASRSVMLLTANELEEPQYDASMLELLRSILETHDLVLLGYSGNDSGLARVIAEAGSKRSNRVFWCSPHAPDSNAPLRALLADRVIPISATFDSLMMQVARPVLERPTLVPTEPTYLGCLFDWRVDHCNRGYIAAYGQRSGVPSTQFLVRRPRVEERLRSFLQSDRQLAIIAGPSGFGKTTIGIQLHRQFTPDSATRIMLLPAKAVTDAGDIEQHIIEQLGGLGSCGPSTLFRLESWLRQNNLRLVLFLDGINEFSPDLQRCIHFFRGIVRLCNFLPDVGSAVRVIATVRQESWNLMLPYVDTGHLRETLWAEGNNNLAGTIYCGPFDDAELHDALWRIGLNHDSTRIAIGTLPASVLDRLRDPYLLSLVAAGDGGSAAVMPGPRLYQQAFDARLIRHNSLVDLATLKSVLAGAAVRCLTYNQDRFRSIDIEPAALRTDILRVTKDLGIIVDAGDGFLQFDHDRTFEFFLAHALSTGLGPSLDTLDDLRAFIVGFRHQSKAMAAARLYFALAPRERFGLISSALRTLDTVDISRLGTDEWLFEFANEVLSELVAHGEPIATLYLADAVQAMRANAVGPKQARAIVHAASKLPIERAVPLLTECAQSDSGLASIEGGIFAVRRLMAKYLTDGCRTVDFLVEQPYKRYFGDMSLAPWQRLGRLLQLGMQLGPDNAHPDEYVRFRAAFDFGLNSCLQEVNWAPADIEQFTRHLLSNCDRLLFNATPHGISRFFGNPGRGRFAPILASLKAGAALSDADVLALEPYTQSLSMDIEYHLTHVLFALSSLNNLEATLGLAERRFRRFSNSTSPVEIDFFHGVLVYLHILHGREYDETRFAWWEEVVLRDWPDVLMHRPGVERGERRGFDDAFDRVFEDGFGVLYPYGLLLPSKHRRESRFAAYLESMTRLPDNPLPLYSTYLKKFLSEGRFEEVIQILQAIGGVIVAWPLEGLMTLRPAVGHPDPRVRRATVRVLAEAFGRYPDETMRFVNASGVSLSDEDMLTIRVRQDPRVGRRQIEVEEWARLAHALSRRSGFQETLVECAEHLLEAHSIEDASMRIAATLGLT